MYFVVGLALFAFSVKDILTAELISCRLKDNSLAIRTNINLIQIMCYGEKLSKVLESLEKCDVNIGPALSILELSDCSLYGNNRTDIFKNINLNVSGIEELVLTFTKTFYFKKIDDTTTKVLDIGRVGKIDTNLFAKMPIKSLTVNRTQTATDLLHLDEDFFNGFKMVRTLSTLLVSHVSLPAFPATTQIQRASLDSGISEEFIGKCSQLLEIDLYDWEVLMDGWLENCHKLISIRMEKLTTNVIQRILSSAYTIKSLTIFDCALDCLRDECSKIFDSNTELEYLNLSNNALWGLHTEAFGKLEKLKELDLSNNPLSLYDIGSALMYAPKPKISILSLSYNTQVNNPCNGSHQKGEKLLRLPNSITKIYFRSFFVFIFEWCLLQFVRTESLEYIDLSKNVVTIKMKYLLELLNHKRPLVVNLKDTQIHSQNEISLVKNVYETITSLKELYNQNVTILMDPVTLECDCEHVWILKALNMFPNLKFKCGNNSDDDTPCLLCPNYGASVSLEQMPQGSLECDRYECSKDSIEDEYSEIYGESLTCDTTYCTERCTCRRYWDTEKVQAYCFGLETFPRITNLQYLYANNNFISNIEPENIPPSLTYLDLSNNKITYVNPETVKKLFSESNRTLKLAGNPFACLCPNRNLLSALIDHRSQIIDFENVTCSGKLITEVDLTKLCDFEQEQPSSFVFLPIGLVICFSVFIALPLLIITYRHRTEVHNYLSSRGLCLCCINKHEGDILYDVFVSYSHEDESFVTDDLIPGLERERYTVCVHYRDWIAGEWIPMQIVRSIQQSHSTLFVVSNNFLTSMWGLLEFRTAMMCSKNDSRSRIILILLDESVAENEQVDPELRVHMASHTYLLWDDPRFWDKLYNSLPHRQRRRTSENLEINELSTY